MGWRIDAKIGRAAFVACISHFARSQGMLFSDPAHWGRMHVVLCGVDPARYPGAPRDPAGAPVLLFVGRLAAIKGLGLLLDAVAALRAHFPALRLVLVGDGPDRARLEARAAAPDLAGAVEFTGYRSQAEVAAYLEACDLFVLPSFAEGVPVVLMEAMAARRPVVATRVAGVAELVADGESGLLVAPGDPAALTAAIGRLLGDPPLRARMGDAGRAQVAAGFDAAREAAWLMRLMQAHRLGGPIPGLRPETAADVPAGETAA
jgi:glycosyltransferase involved in cell wall biosynthesis